jgi:glycine dehydrogenase subunit 1
LSDADTVYPYIPNSVPEIKAQMMREIGMKDASELHAAIPDRLRFKGELGMEPRQASEPELKRHVKSILSKNATCDNHVSFLGGGCWQHFVPAVCDEINQRAEFLTAYATLTYNDHGKHQAMFEFASMLGELLEMDAVSNPTYDWTSAACMSIRMAARITGRNEIVLPQNINPDKLAALQNFAKPDLKLNTIGFDPDTRQLDLAELERRVSASTAAVYIENPTYLGVVEASSQRIGEIAHEHGALLLVGVDPSSLGVLVPPARYGADIVCGELQPLGMHMQYGGGLAGFIASSDDPKFVYQYPSYMGSIVPGAVPGEFGFGHVVYKRTAYVSREKGNDFEGTGAGLWGITAAVYMALMGPQGFHELGEAIMARSHYAARMLSQIDRLNVPGLDAPFFKEFVVNFDCASRSVAEVNRALLDHGIFGGKDLTQTFPSLGSNALYCVTEMITQADIDRLVQSLAEIIQ